MGHRVPLGAGVVAALLTLVIAASGQQQPGTFQNLRFEEDWSFLDDPEASTTHFFPTIKRVELDDSWWVSFGGQERLRWQQEDNKSLTGKSPRSNDFMLNRARLHADLRHDSGFRVFVEMLDARIYGEERPPTPIDRNTFEPHNAFAEYATGDTTVRAGRMELQYGAQRLVSPLDWGNTRRRFEGVLVRQKLDGARVDGFVTKFVPVDPHEHDDDDDSLWMSGVYSTFPLREGEGLDAYLLSHNETDENVVSGGGRPGGFDVYTTGLRHWTKSGPFDWEGEASQQFGSYAGDQVRATSLAARGGWTEKELPGKPRFGLDLDWASGDDDPTDSSRQTFNQLFPLGHAYLGYIDLVGRQNIFAIQPNVTVQLGERTNFRAAYHWFKLDQREDALYNAGGAPTLKDPTGAAGTDVGRELDLTVVHKPAILGPHGNVLVGYSRFTPGEFVETLGSTKHTTLAYVELLFTF